ncbi:hypothetical protein D3C84_1017440 [compost metagenome]
MVAGFSDGGVDRTGAVINAEGTIGKTAGAADVGEHGHHHCGAGTADAILGCHAGNLARLVAQPVVGHGLDGVGDFQVLGVEGVLEHGDGRKAAVDQAVGLVPFGNPFDQKLLCHQPRTPSR